MAALVDTNVLVYRFDPRDPRKQTRARDLLREGLTSGAIRVPHQALVEFVAVVTKPQKDGGPALMPVTEAWHELENLLTGFAVLYPTDDVLRAAVRGASLHRLRGSTPISGRTPTATGWTKSSLRVFSTDGCTAM